MEVSFIVVRRLKTKDILYAIIQSIDRLLHLGLSQLFLLFTRFLISKDRIEIGSLVERIKVPNEAGIFYIIRAKPDLFIGG